MFVAMSLLTLAYVGLYHPYWARGFDAEVYLATARNLVRGEGYTYNGNPVGLIPPLWPMVLAAGMWLTSVIGILKLIMPICVLVWLGSAFLVMRRFAGPWMCAAAILIVGTLQGVLQMTLWFYTEPLFLALSWLALLMAFGASERHAQARPWLGRTLLACLFLSAAVATRWPGILWWPIVATGFLQGRHLFRPGPDSRTLTLQVLPRRFDGMWFAAVLSAAFVAVTFFALRYLIKVDPSEVNPRYDPFMTGAYSLINPHGRPTVWTHVERFVDGPQWLSVLYWNWLGRMRGTDYWAWYAAALTAVPLAIAGLVGLCRRQWIWMGVAAAWVPVMVTWPHAIDRYSMPVAPLLVLGTILGAFWIGRQLDRKIGNWPWLVRRLTAIVMLGPLGLLLAYNGSVYGLEWWVNRDYFARYEGGTQPSLNRIAHYLRTSGAADAGGDVGITRWNFSEHFARHGHIEDRLNQAQNVRRNLVFLLDRSAIELPIIPDFNLENQRLYRQMLEKDIRWLILVRKTGLRYNHLYQLPWHENRRPSRFETDYHLYRLTPFGLLPVDPLAESSPHEVLIVPGLEDVNAVAGPREWLPIPYN